MFKYESIAINNLFSKSIKWFFSSLIIKHSFGFFQGEMLQVIKLISKNVCSREILIIKTTKWWQTFQEHLYVCAFFLNLDYTEYLSMIVALLKPLLFYYSHPLCFKHYSHQLSHSHLGLISSNLAAIKYLNQFWTVWSNILILFHCSNSMVSFSGF